jgi:hypothetical protein
MDFDKNISNQSIFDYIRYANKGKGYINNSVVLKNQKISIFEDGHFFDSCASDIQVTEDIPSGNYHLTLLSDSHRSCFHNCIFWATKYNFQFTDNVLSFNIEGKRIEIS